MILSNLTNILTHLLHFVLRPIFHLIYIKKPPSIPPIRNPLLKINASTLARKIRHGELSSRTVVEAYIERIKEVNPFLNAVVEERFKAAVNEAKICDAKLQTGKVTAATLEREKPLYGVPVTIKETCSLAGMSYTGGTWSRKGVKATKDGAAVELLKDAGVIPLCVTNTPEMCSGIHTTNHLYGTTNNPYDTRKSPGGSSGGEGAILGAGASVFGLGSDVLGSIRIPGLFNGVFGHKPTSGITPNQGHIPTLDQSPLGKMLVCGPMTRYAEDLHLGMKVLSAKCEKPLDLDVPVDVKTLRVFYLDNFDSFCGIRSTTADIRRTIAQATDYLAGNGARVEHLSQDWVSDMYIFLMACFSDVQMPELQEDPKYNERNKRPLLEFVKALFGLSDYTLTLAYLQLLKKQRGFIPRSKQEYYRQQVEDIGYRVNKLLGSDGVFICPAFSQPTDLATTISLQTDSIVYSAFSNMMNLPSTYVPMGLNSDGLPVGFQVMAASYQDRLTLAVARELETVFGGWVPPPS
ncbi:fatty-acid amide hydrolase 2-B-like [Hylaeus volcanicus]|uniref:fatty-acid amide hydrolase 2-B-like n=1 Tax=Hylaeus volcanicus TaxID=313075 RepID=UPI0023B83FD7|nr:fatty-acid amide hydrolase 2-B-like [Hylaeus volcanicus]XP_053970718.1 fatty-acid amide hydrolase 2-B-like [Hylaeus volcanicus]